MDTGHRQPRAGIGRYTRIGSGPEGPELPGPEPPQEGPAERGHGIEGRAPGVQWHLVHRWHAGRLVQET